MPSRSTAGIANDAQEPGSLIAGGCRRYGRPVPPLRQRSPLEGGLVVVELELRQVSQVHGEEDSEVAVGVAGEVEGGTPLVQIALEPHLVGFEPVIRQVVLRIP